ncbi:MAG: murein biosynthesis integral membrane protein MurJ [Nocardioides sp.]
MSEGPGEEGVPGQTDPHRSEPAPEPAPEPAQEAEQQRVLANSAVMAAGTIVSRMSGFVRSALLAAALGASLHAELFNIANTIPNMLYILLAGGVFNAVLVPQLVRSMRNDADGGAAYLSRIVTLAALFLGFVTVLLVVAAPWVMEIYLSPDYDDPELAAQRQSIIDFARLCLPQVFFYGMFVLVGQVLNARGRFGPMMWAPIANNVISVGVLVLYLFVFGPAQGAEVFGAFTPGQELMLGLGATLGIVAQFAVLVPYLRASGVRYRPRFDFRHTGLGHTLRLAVWTVLFVIVNQIAYTVVVRLASSGPASAGDGTGYTVYAYTFLIVMVPHSVVTVSLATAILPGLSSRAAAGDRTAMARSLSETLRTALAVVVPFALLLPVIATDLSHVIWGYGAAADAFDTFAPSLALFGIGLVFFTVHYLMLRGFYALELTRTVFWIQCAVAVTNVVVAVLLVRAATAAETTPALVLAYSASYLVGSLISYAVLRRLLGGLRTPTLVRFLLRLAIAAAAATALAAATAALLTLVNDEPGWLLALVRLLVVGGVDAVVLIALARVLRLREVTAVVDTLTRRLPVLRRP